VRDIVIELTTERGTQLCTLRRKRKTKGTTKMKKISRKSFLKLASAAAMSGITAGALPAMLLPAARLHLLPLQSTPRAPTLPRPRA
jgi:hypothetical protein